jgi:hypothetical protein
VLRCGALFLEGLSSSPSESEIIALLLFSGRAEVFWTGFAEWFFPVEVLPCEGIRSSRLWRLRMHFPAASNTSESFLL